jgi:poly-gamma-glutamate synthesis protein (capsule biosynthesis protein)
VLLAAVGDVMVSRTVPGRLTAHGPAWAWAKIAPALAEGDLRFCNLECAVTRGGVPVPKRYSFRADPGMTKRALAAGGFGIVSLANNHTYDFGRAGLGSTLAFAEGAGLAAAGAGTGRARAVAPRVVTCRGLKIAFVAYTRWTPEGYLPADDGPALATLDEGTLAAELRAAKRGADLLVVSLHWGQEYARTPSAAQRRLAHAAIDAGADLILGHHPHVAQPVEVYRGRPIVYSLGNCLFDNTDGRECTGLLVLVRLARGRVTVARQVPLRVVDARAVPAARSPVKR